MLQPNFLVIFAYIEKLIVLKESFINKLNNITL